ncbi:hypothetical protein BJ170DRAFT_47253 [Xylariales sp. AK1849]|nr:hypothetical protein BJ170DRAFT_47253 [Xylariales sp. AK1849]
MPFYMPSKGLAIKDFVGQIALIIKVYVNPITLVSISYHYYMFFLSLNCLWLFLIWMFFPESNGYSLVELSMLFDGVSDPTQMLEGKVMTDKSGSIIEETEEDLREQSLRSKRV